MTDQIKRVGMLVIGLLLGLSVWYFAPKTVYQTLTTTEIMVKRETKTQVVNKVKDRVVTITKPGETIVITEKEKTDSVTKEDTKTETKQDTATSISPGKSRYGVSAGISTGLDLTPRYSVGVDFRLGDLPVFLGVFATYPQTAAGITLRLEM